MKFIKKVHVFFYLFLLIPLLSFIILKIFVNKEYDISSIELTYLIVFTFVYIVFSEVLMIFYRRKKTRDFKRVSLNTHEKLKDEAKFLIINLSITTGTLVLCILSYIVSSSIWFLFLLTVGLIIYFLKYPSKKMIKSLIPEKEFDNKNLNLINSPRFQITNVILSIVFISIIVYFIVSSILKEFEKSSNEIIDLGTIENNNYKNESLCWYFNIPNDYEVSKENKLDILNSKISSKYKNQNRILFTLTNKTSFVTASIEEQTSGITKESYERKIKELIEKTKIGSSEPKFTNGLDIYLDDQVFRALDFLVQAEKPFRILNMSTFYQSYIINIVFIYTNEKSSLTLINALQKSSFGCN